MSNFPSSFSSLFTLSWNCNSLQIIMNEFKIFISDHSHIDFTFLQEIYSPTCNISIPGYRVHYTRRANGTSRDGTAIYVKHHIPHYQTQNTTYTDIEFKSIFFNLFHININLTSTYDPRNGHFPVNSLSQLFSHHQHGFFVGDYNFKKRRRGTSQRIASLHNLIQHLNLSLYARSTPTHINTQPITQNSIIDCVLFENLPYPITTTVINYFLLGISWSASKLT